MKTIVFISLFSIGIVSCEQSMSQKFKGVLNDIDPKESKILYTCKDAVNEAYSNGNLYIYDVNKRTNMVVSKIRYMEYGIKSYFKDNDSILVINHNEILLCAVNPSNNSRSIMKLNEKKYYLSSKKINSKLVLTVLDNNNSLLGLFELNVNDLTIKQVTTIKVNIIPTDNFFDIININKKNFLFDNGFLFEFIDENRTDMKIKVAFNAILGKYIMSNNENSICFVTDNKDNTYNAILISENGIKTLPIIIPKNVGQISIDEIKDNENCFSLKIGNDIYYINHDGVCKRNTSEVLFLGKKISVYKNSDFEFEIK